jgi:hypothetical protein
VPEDDERRGGLLTDAVLRPLVFACWSLLLWGTLALLAWMWQAFGDGASATLALARRSVSEGLWGTLNVVLPALAAVVWVAVGVAALRRRRRARGAD